MIVPVNVVLNRTDVLTTCAVVIFRLKVSCTPSVDLVNEVTVLLVVCQLSSDVIFRSIYCHSLTVVEILHYS